MLPERPLKNSGANGGNVIRDGGVRFGAQSESEPKQNSADRDWPAISRKRPASKAKRIFLALVALILLGGLTASAYILKTWLGGDSRFRINGASNIQASGLTEVSRAEMLPVFGEDIGRNVFFVPLGARRRQLEEIPWVERATVMRLLPDQIRVSIVERQPVAFTRQGQQVGLVDANGVLLTMPAAMMAQHHYSFPVVTGIEANDSLASRKARMAVYQRLLAELDANGQHISSQISEIDLTDPADARVLMPEQGGDILAHFGQEQFMERYLRYKAHIVDWRRQYPNLTGVDLRYEQQVVLQMASGAKTDQAAVDEQAAATADAQDKPSTPAEKTPEKVVAKSALAVHAAPNSPTHKPAAKAGVSSNKPSAAAKKTKPVGNSSAKAKAAAAKDKAAKAKTAKAKAISAKAKEKKRAELKRAALNANRHTTAPATHSAANARMGQ
jgi:cell division protein FtsQ